MGYKEHFLMAMAVTAITTLILGMFVIIQDRKNRLYLVFSLYSFSIAFWCTLQIGNVYGPTIDISTLFARYQHIGVVFIPTLFLHFVFLFLGIKDARLRLIKACYVVSFFLLILVPTHLIASHSEKKVNGLINFGEPGPLYPALIVFFITTTSYCLNLIYSDYVKSFGERRTQIGLLFWSSLIGYIGGSSNFLLVYDISVYPFNPFGTYCVAIYVLVTFYAIFKYQLLGIEVVIKRTLVFAGLFAFVYGIFSTFTIIGQNYFETMLEWNKWIAMIPTVLVITFALRPLEIFLTNATEKYLFQKKYDYRQLLKTFTGEVLTVLELQQLLDKTIDGLNGIIKLESSGLFLLNGSSGIYELRASHGIRESKPTFSIGNPLVYLLNASSEPIRREAVKVEDALTEFKNIGAELCLPIIFNEKMIGFLSLGMKKSGEHYTQEDVDILSSLARTEAIAISNAQLFQELAKTQAEAAQREKMAVIGTLAAGINHEICNPLGIARGQCEMFLLNFKDGLYKDVPETELIEKCAVIFNKVINEIDRATGITKRLSSFAKPSTKFAFNEVSVVQEINEVLAILGHELRLDNVEVANKVSEGLTKIFVDKKQIQEVFFNIIRNAAQAISGKGSITVTGSEKGDRVYIEIQDSGCGIPADKIKEIFNPFYTTKAPGKGTGLGLFIVKQVVERNKGTIAVESEVGKGTKFTLSFEAAKQMAAA